MRTNNPSIKYNYIVDILRTTSEEHTDLQNRLFSESRENARSFKSILHHKINDTPELIDDLWAFRKIVSAIGEYILRHHAPVSAKQRLYADLYALCKQIAQQRGIENYEAYLDVLPEPVSDDITIALIKALHDRDGITKEEFARLHTVDPRTIQNRIQALDFVNDETVANMDRYL